MSAVKTLEKNMSSWFKSAPTLSKGVKKQLVEAAPWAVVVIGALQMYAAWGLWEILHRLERLNHYGSSLNRIYTQQTLSGYMLSGSDRLALYLGVVVLVVDGVIFIKSYSELKKHSRRGWELAFVALLINAAYAVLSLFFYHRLIIDHNFDSFLFSFVWITAGFYLLFQVRDMYTGKKV